MLSVKKRHCVSFIVHVGFPINLDKRYNDLFLLLKITFILIMHIIYAIIEINTLNIIEDDKFLKGQTIFPHRINMHLAEAKNYKSFSWKSLRKDCIYKG